MIYEITNEELEHIKESYFTSLNPLILNIFPAKEKKKYGCLLLIKEIFELGKEYTEMEISSLLKPVYFDFVTLRRYLVDYHFLERTKDGRRYWKTTL